ncbi:MAG: type II toxin-antitoxin system PemK/MazF family toxin [Candidatus Rokubacteria bacterium]|nr:type II toxin-antitoxin system PemK/MazF family toxin [Candidatus Rokubacteria bacterium]
MRRRYTPSRGDVVWLTFHPQAGRRPALVLSPASYNGKVGLAIFCPMTSQVKGYPFGETRNTLVSTPGLTRDWSRRRGVLLKTALARATEKGHRDTAAVLTTAGAAK